MSFVKYPTESTMKVEKSETCKVWSYWFFAFSCM